VIDLSATPFFLRGSGYAEGTLFPWTMSDFSLMDAIECGIVKLPRVPIADNIPGNEMPKFRNLWEHIRKRMPKKGRGKAKSLDPLSLPVELQTALAALYGHYEKTYALWQDAGLVVPPCFIVVCNNTSTSKLVYDYISGFHRDDGDGPFVAGRLALFRNFDPGTGNAYPRPRTLLIDSEQLESGDAFDGTFRGTRTPSRTCSASARSVRSSCASRSSGAPSAGSRTTSTRKANSTSSTPTSSASRSTSRRSR
jgi:type III restriction enzyme